MSLRRAAEGNNLDEVFRLLRHGVDPNCRDFYHRTPLHHAAFYGYEKICLLLIPFGADCNALDDSKQTPLQKAAWKGHVKVC